MKVDERLEVKLKKVIEGINLIPTFRKNIREELSEEITTEKVDDILNLELSLESLNESELKHLFKVIFKFSNDEDFNPIKVLQSRNKQEEKYTKDFDENLYYNYDFKMKFTNTRYREKTRKVVRALFRKSAKFELSFGKDLYDFSADELEEFFRSLQAKTLRSIQNSISTVEQYIRFAIKNNKTTYKVNNATLFNSREHTEKLIDKDAEEHMIFDKKEIMDMAKNSDNAQDGVIPALIFDGVSSKKKHNEEFYELVNLKNEDIDWNNNEIVLEDRRIPMSKETVELVRDAIKENIYQSINGERTRKYKIAKSDYVLRGLRGNRKIKWRNIIERIARIAEYWGYKKYLNATNISYSGQIYYAKELLDKGMDIEEVVDKILFRFGANINPSSQFYLKSRIEKYIDKNSH